MSTQDRLVSATSTGAVATVDPLGKYEVLAEDSGFDESDTWYGTRVLELDNEEVETARPAFSRSTTNVWPGESGLFAASITGHSLRAHPTKVNRSIVICRYTRPDDAMILQPGRGLMETHSIPETKGVWIGMRNTYYMNYYNSPWDYLRGGEPTQTKMAGGAMIFIPGQASQSFPRKQVTIRTVAPISEYSLWDGRNDECLGMSNKFKFTRIGRDKKGGVTKNAGLFLYQGATIRPRPRDVQWIEITIPLLWDPDGWEFRGSFLLVNLRRMDSAGEVTNAGMRAVRQPLARWDIEAIPENGYKAFEDYGDKTIERGKMDMRWIDELMGWLYDKK